MRASRPPRPTAVSAAAQNACTVCMPLGACLAYRGIEGAMPFLHGPQGCATYIRRFLIGHFREPMDIACSSFNEHSAIFGGGQDLHRGLNNVGKQYDPKMIGIATTCLAETIGDDMPMLLDQYKKNREAEGPDLAWAATPSYHGTQADGFHAAVHAIVNQCVEEKDNTTITDTRAINLFPCMLSPADLRHLREMVDSFGVSSTLMPDYSDTLDRPAMAEYERIPAGGTPLAAIRTMSSAAASIQLGRSVKKDYNAARLLFEKFGVTDRQIGIPIGIQETDRFIETIEELTGLTRPESLTAERGRLVDSYVDGHKYLFGKRIAIVGDEDLVIGLAAFIAETGALPTVCATGGRSGAFTKHLEEALDGIAKPEAAAEGVDFSEAERMIDTAKVDLILGSSRCAPMATRQRVPLLRVGMPIHDRIGAQRVLHTGYRGAQALYDRMVNTFIELEQNRSDAGYMTM